MTRWAVLLGLLAGCSAAGRIDVRVENKTGRPIILNAKTGIFRKSMKLVPGQTFDGWVDPRWSGKSIVVVLEEVKE